jgi:hypothetical protein
MFRRTRAKRVRSRRVSPVASRHGEGPFIPPTAAVPVWLPELVFVPLNGHSSLDWQSRPSCGGCMAIGDSAAGSRNVGSCDVNSLQVARRRPCSTAGSVSISRRSRLGSNSPRFSSIGHGSGETGVDALESASRQSVIGSFVGDHVCACSPVHTAVLRLLNQMT